jgi:alpha-galactosidase
MQMTAGCKNPPYMVIDAGWQRDFILQNYAYNGGPWIGNSRFGDMQRMAEEIHNRGAKAGLWERPLLTHDPIPAEAKIASQFGGDILDPSHPFALEKIYNDTAMIRSWGYDLIKHDFTACDLTSLAPLTSEKHDYQLFAPDRKLYDRTKTTAMVFKNLYKTIQDAANGAEVIGCNVFGHLSAGIHSVQRTGGDTSGRAYEWTKRDGVNTVMRLPTNNIFYNVDPDCAAVTDQVPVDSNLDFLEMCAYTGMTTLASVTPGCLNDAQMQRINEIYKIADANEHDLGIANYDKVAEPEIFVSEDGKIEKRFDWTKPYHGSRVVLKWTETKEDD